jgi:DNA-binding response OmpR family regulator
MGRRTLLIVDDDRSFVEAVAIFLTDHGYRVIESFGGVEGLDRLRRNDVDLAIVDVHLPDLGGIDLTATALDAGLVRAVILISSDDHPEVARRAVAAGANAFLAKPLAPAQLLDTIAKTVSNRAH